MPVFDDLPKREREIVAIVYRLGHATARDVQKTLADGTSYSAVRTFLALLESKGIITHRLEGKSYLWAPARDPEKEGASLIVEAMRTFFKGSRERAIAALIESGGQAMTEKEYAALAALIDKARRKGR
jgi:BlaI family transcriptional regulator, penicillinase repressor